MLTFLTRLAQVDSVQDVFLVSPCGELLFVARKGTDKNAEDIGRWNEVIAGLDGSPATELFFEKGCYYVQDLGIGHVVVGMKEVRNLDRVKTACVQVQKKLAGPAVRKKVLLKMLTDMDEPYKAHLVKALPSLSDKADREVAALLLDLLRQEGRRNLQENEELLVALCEALGHCHTPAVLAVLKDLLKNYSGALPEAVVTAAKIAVQQLRLDMPEPASSSQAKEPEAMVPAGPRKNGPPAGKGIGSADREPIEELLKLGKKGEAIEGIMTAIEAAARNRLFDEAEKLREWLMQIDSMAIREIIRAAEIIEQAKTGSVSREYQETWRDLAQVLSPEEFSTLYHIMTPRLYAKDEMVVRQGEISDSLYFVNSGRVQFFAVSQDREIPLKIFGAGEILGAENFFEISVWTVNARSLGAELGVLPRENLRQQKELHPALEGKLMDYSMRIVSANSLFRKTGRTRRRFERRKAAGRATMVVLDERGQETGVGAKGDILDVSKGGMSFSLRFSQKRNAAVLLGKNIKVQMRAERAAGSLICNGRVKAVRCCDFIGSDYSMHVEFQKELENAQLQLLLGKSK